MANKTKQPNLNKINPLTKKVKEWFLSRIKTLNRFDGLTSSGDISLIKKLTNDPKRSSSPRNFDIGKMYFFIYDAKYKNNPKVLPYWDRVPLIFVVDEWEKGFLGINLHYLPPIYRARLLNALMAIRNNKSMDNTTRLKLSYELLKNSSKYKLFRPCLKRYIFSHIKSKISLIEPLEWNFVIYLPLARWKRKRQETVWKKSMEIVRKS